MMGTGEWQPARMNYFANISIRVDDTPSQVNLVSLSYFKTHPQKHKCGKPATIWEKDLFYECNIIPVQDIICRTVTLTDNLNERVGNGLFVLPYYFSCFTINNLLLISFTRNLETHG